MWNWFNCYLSGRHDYGMWCEPGNIFLRCVHCGRRSAGWAVNATNIPTPAAPPPSRAAVLKPSVVERVTTPRVLPFNRAAAN